MTKKLSEFGTDGSGNIDLTGGDLTVTGSVLLTGFLNLGTPTELTISGGAVTATRSYHVVDTEGDAASDDLDTINGGAEGDVLVIRTISGARDVVVKHGTGNIKLDGLADKSLSSASDRLTLMYDGANWQQIGFSNNG